LEHSKPDGTPRKLLDLFPDRADRVAASVGLMKGIALAYADYVSGASETNRRAYMNKRKFGGLLVCLIENFSPLNRSTKHSRRNLTATLPPDFAIALRIIHSSLTPSRGKILRTTKSCRKYDNRN
jgi:hypothetical protein